MTSIKIQLIGDRGVVAGWDFRRRFTSGSDSLLIGEFSTSTLIVFTSLYTDFCCISVEALWSES